MDEEQRRRRSGIPAVVPRALGHLPGRAGEVASGAARDLRDVRFVGLVAEVAFFAGAGVLPLVVAALAVVGALEPALPTGVAARVDDLIIRALADVLRAPVSTDAVRDVHRLLGGGARAIAWPLLVTVALSARGYTGAMRGLAHLYGNEAARPVVRDALATVAFTLGATLLAAAAVVGVLITAPAGPRRVVVELLRWPIIVAGLVTWLTSLYHYARGPDEGTWASEVPGAVVAATTIVGVGLAYGAYLRVTPSLWMGDFLGVVVGVGVATFSLLFAIAFGLLVGGAVNAERAQLSRRAR